MYHHYTLRVTWLDELLMGYRKHSQANHFILSLDYVTQNQTIKNVIKIIGEVCVNRFFNQVRTLNLYREKTYPDTN